ncbi:MAG: hypothetical protein U0838_05990 [Chloroflexota bacterium]
MTLGAARIGALATKIDTRAKEGSIEGADELLSEIDVAFGATVAELRALVNASGRRGRPPTLIRPPVPPRSGRSPAPRAALCSLRRAVPTFPLPADLVASLLSPLAWHC